MRDKLVFDRSLLRFVGLNSAAEAFAAALDSLSAVAPPTSEVELVEHHEGGRLCCEAPSQTTSRRRRMIAAIGENSGQMIRTALTLDETAAVRSRAPRAQQRLLPLGAIVLRLERLLA